MRKFLFILLFLPIISYCQNSLPEAVNDGYFTSFEKVSSDTYQMYKEDRKGIFGNPAKMRRKMIEKANEFAKKNQFDLIFVSQDIHPIGILGDWASFTYTFKLVNQQTETTLENSPESKNYEKEIKNILDSSKLSNIEGIYDYSGAKGGNQYRLAILKDGENFVATIIESNNNKFPVRSKKAIFYPAAMNGAFTVKWIIGAGSEVVKTIALLENGLIKFSYPLNGDSYDEILYKMYPRNNQINTNYNASNSWRGNGSGIFISSSGYIITNHHVVKNATDIEVEFQYKDEIKEYMAKVVQVDEINDLAIIKVNDERFSAFPPLPYNLKTTISDVGTEVFALGYPMALSIMGKEIKFTDGKISSKTGFKGDITTYQTTTPIQPGNSGGPLFDNHGNLIGINSSIIRKDIAENVSYAIKSNYLLNLLDVLPESFDLPSSSELSTKKLTEQIKILSEYVVLIKIK